MYIYIYKYIYIYIYIYVNIYATYKRYIYINDIFIFVDTAFLGKLRFMKITWS